jgi:hypothetical protein
MKYLKSKTDSVEEAILQMWEKAAKRTEDNTNDKSDDGEGLDKVQPKALKKKFKNRKDKDIDNDGDVDASDKYLHKRRKPVSKAISKEARQEESLDVGTPENTKSKLEATPGQSVDAWEEQLETIQKKNSSMRERLAQIWDMDEGKNPFEKENKKEEKASKKTMTGEPVTKVEVDPKISNK